MEVLGALLQSANLGRLQQTEMANPERNKEVACRLKWMTVLVHSGYADIFIIMPIMYYKCRLEYRGADVVILSLKLHIFTPD